MQSAEQVRSMYQRIGEPVTPAAGAVFYGVLSMVDASLFDAVQAGELQLRYADEAATLQRGDVVQVRGQHYRVSEPPRRIGDGRERIATLIEVQP